MIDNPILYKEEYTWDRKDAIKPTRLLEIKRALNTYSLRWKIQRIQHEHKNQMEFSFRYGRMSMMRFYTSEEHALFVFIANIFNNNSLMMSNSVKDSIKSKWRHRWCDELLPHTILVKFWYETQMGKSLHLRIFLIMNYGLPCSKIPLQQ